MKWLSIYTLSFHVIALSATGEWKWQNPQPQGGSLHCIHFLSPDTGFIGGDAGVFLRTYNGGSNWKVSNIAGGGSIWGLGFGDSKTGLLLQGLNALDGRKNNNLLLTQNSGETWQKVLAATGISDHPIQWVDPKTVFLGTDSLLKKSRNGGKDWSDCGLSGYQILSYDFQGPDRGYVLAKSGSIYLLLETTDGCAQFASVRIPDSIYYSTVRFRDSVSVFLGGTGGQSVRFLHSEDDGKTWLAALVAEPQPFGLRSLQFTDNRNGYGFALDGTLLRSRDGGSTWTSNYSAPTRDVQSDFVNDTIGYWAGTYGLIKKSLDGGENWEEISHGTFDSATYAGVYSGLSDVSFADANTGVAVGGKGSDRTHGIMLRTINAGGRWDTVSIPRVPYLLSVRFRDASFGLAVGDSGVVLKSTDGGATWEQVGRAGASLLYYVRFGLGNNIFAYGRGSGPLLRSTDAGQTWSKAISDSGLIFNSLDIRPAQIGMVAGSRSARNGRRPCVFRTMDGGDTWNELSMAIPGSDTVQGKLNSIDVVAPGNAFAVDGRGILYQSHDNGMAWDSLANLTPYGRIVLFKNADSGFAANNNGIEFTQDGGRTWTQQLSMPDGSMISTLALSPNGNAYAVGIMGSIWFYQSGSTPIRPVADRGAGHNLVVDGRGIRYRVDSRAPVNLSLTQMNGVLVAKLSQGLQNPGEYYVPLPSGHGAGPWLVDVSVGNSRYRKVITNLLK